MDDIKQMYEDVVYLERVGHWKGAEHPSWVVEMIAHYGGIFPSHACASEAWRRIACALAAEKGW